jgi:hypothetical protein
MKVFAAHDEAGRIIGLTIPAADVEDGQFGVIAEPGQYVSEIEVDHTRGRSPQEVLADLAQNYRVERLATPGRFVTKRSRATSNE